MIVRVWRQASKAKAIARVIVATDDERIAAPVRAAGGRAMMTSPEHASGTDRIAEVASKIVADIISACRATSRSSRPPISKH